MGENTTRMEVEIIKTQLKEQYDEYVTFEELRTFMNNYQFQKVSASDLEHILRECNIIKTDGILDFSRLTERIVGTEGMT